MSLGPPITPEQIAALPPDFRALLQAVIDYYEKRISALEAEVAAVKKTPRNSSLPPSVEHPHAKPAPQREKSGKKAGGQAGHSKHERRLIPAEHCQAVVPVRPLACRRCSEPLAGSDSDPLRHQVWEIPEIKPLVTEYQLHRLTCPRCSARTCAPLPPGVPHSQGGPRLVALTALLMGCFKQSKRRVALFLEQVLHQPCSAGWVVKLQNQATDALRPAYEELAAQLPTEPVLGIDESPTKEAQAKSWLWTFVAGAYTVFAQRTTRAATVLHELLGDAFDGVVNCDRAKMYWNVGRPQWCWAHLKRDFQALIDHPDHQVKRLGRDLMRPTRELFRHGARCRDGTITRAGMLRLMRPIRQEIDSLLLRGAFSDHPKLAGMCGPLYDHRDWLWTFLDVEGIEPTNNVSERALRPAVIWRKLSFGTQSARGSHFVETILTVVETCHRQSRNSFEYLAAAVQAHFAGLPAPSLLAGA
ncbi:MAG TPA: IS66 family transposase [Candidatus Binataceae bacterium]|nr:IS66 family transposase [Candidatus Binataceae bacterium]